MTDSSVPCGTSACEQRTWPRLIITLSPDDGSANVIFRARYGDGVEREAVRGGCPYGFGSINCSYSFFGDSVTHELTVEAVANGEIVVGPTVPLRQFNYCGVGVANLVVQVADAGSLVFRDPVYVSPCNAL